MHTAPHHAMARAGPGKSRHATPLLVLVAHQKKRKEERTRRKILNNKSGEQRILVTTD
jgi:hypothetical protein